MDIHPSSYAALNIGKTDYFLFFLPMLISNAGSRTRFVTVAVTSVRDVSQPRACVPPKPLKQKMIKPAMSTNEV
jgi:hypothetical protein